MKIILTQDEINELTLLHKTIKDKSNADKIKCLILYSKGWSWNQIKEALLISEHFISYLLEKYETGGIEAVLKSNYKGHNYKMTNEQEKKLSDYVENNFVPKAKCACDFIKTKFGIEYTEDGMVLTLKRLGFTFKKPKIVPGKIPDKKVQEEFEKKANDVFDNLKDDEAALFMDGSGLVHNVKIGYGWIKKGQKKTIKTNTGRRKMNINGLYNPINNEVICIEKEGSEEVNQQSNIKLVEKLIEKNVEKKKFYIFLDNAPSNKGSLFLEYIANLKDVKIMLIYLPAYSPNLNLIERLWKYSKKILLSVYYADFKIFKERITCFFENEISNEYHRCRLKTFIGKKMQIIDI